MRSTPSLRASLSSTRSKKAKITVHHFAVIVFIVIVGAAVLQIRISQQVHTANSIHAADKTDLQAVKKALPQQPQEQSLVRIQKSNEADAIPALPTSEKITVAYVISMIECTDNHQSGQSSIAGLRDAALVLAHSIHLVSQKSQLYDYKLYAIVHEQAQACAPVLEKAGYTILVKKPPLRQDEIQDPYLRKTIHREVCCGADEFVKLYAYTIEDHPLVVHLDMDVVFQKPLDDVFTVMLHNTPSNRQNILLEPKPQHWPDDDIQAMITRDYHSTFPGRKAGFQAGFWILKPNQTHFDRIVNLIKTTNYVEGMSPQNGWGGLGYGQFVGAKAMQGIIAYYYDQHVNGTWMELNNCRYNAVQAEVQRRGRCLNLQDTCEDCRTTPLEDIINFHYTACRKPWMCHATKWDMRLKKNNTYNRKYSIPTDIVIYEQCLAAQRVWHSVRRDLETRLYELTQDESLPKQQQGNYQKDFFLGHCSQDQKEGYLPLGGSMETLARIPELYRNDKRRTVE